MLRFTCRGEKQRLSSILLLLLLLHRLLCSGDRHFQHNYWVPRAYNLIRKSNLDSIKKIPLKLIYSTLFWPTNTHPPIYLQQRTLICSLLALNDWLTERMYVEVTTPTNNGTLSVWRTISEITKPSIQWRVSTTADRPPETIRNLYKFNEFWT